MDSPIPHELPTISATLASTFVALYAIHYALVYFDIAILPPQELLWNALVYLLPTPLLLDAARRHELRANNMLSQTHAAKSDALRRVFGLGGSPILSHLPSAVEGAGIGRMVRRASISMNSYTRPAATSDAPAGLGNWDNSCYQNSVLQALASLKSLATWLDRSDDQSSAAATAPTTTRSLQETLAKLRDPANNGRHLWTPAKLKNMSSWQQQDAQEYFSKVMDELDKEASRALASRKVMTGLEGLVHEADDSATETAVSREAFRNPLEGLVAQRVACVRCGFSEGYSMIPFNCLTVPLGAAYEYELDECLDEYTKREEIEGVECRRCTLLRAEEQLKSLSSATLPQPPSAREDPSTPPLSTLALPPELRVQIARRLSAVSDALARDDFSDKTLKEACEIPAKAFVSSTKTREALIGRAPQTLIVHINRSLFDELTGMQRKNYARVDYPPVLDLQPWMLDTGGSSSSPATASCLYRLKAVVTHFGRHENGHYYCFKEHPRALEPDDEGSGGDAGAKFVWWKLSDENVSRSTWADALNQAGVFMLFYERDASLAAPIDTDLRDAIALPLPTAPELDSVEEEKEESVSALPQPSAAVSDPLGTESEPLATSSVAAVHEQPLSAVDDVAEGSAQPAYGTSSVEDGPVGDEGGAPAGECLSSTSASDPSVATASDPEPEPSIDRAVATKPPLAQPPPPMRTASPQYPRHDLGLSSRAVMSV